MQFLTFCAALLSLSAFSNAIPLDAALAERQTDAITVDTIGPIIESLLEKRELLHSVVGNTDLHKKQTTVEDLLDTLLDLLSDLLNGGGGGGGGAGRVDQTQIDELAALVAKLQDLEQ